MKTKLLFALPLITNLLASDSDYKECEDSLSLPPVIVMSYDDNPIFQKLLQESVKCRLIFADEIAAVTEFEIIDEEFRIHIDEGEERSLVKFSIKEMFGDDWYRKLGIVK